MPTNPSTTPTLVRFYDPAIQAPDPSGRTVSSILALPDTDLEHRHDYIQLLFPLPEPSPYHPTAPVIDRATFAAFRSRPDLRSRLLTSLTRMLHFYGLDLPARSQRPPARDDDDDDDDPRPEIVRGANFARASRNWVRRFDHNHLRITRIVRCLRVLGLEGHAAALFRALGSVYDGGRAGIGAKSMMFWTRAAERPLYLAPEDERDEGRGKDFLYEYEASRQAGANGDGDGGDGAREGNGQGGEGAGGKDGAA
ncbi:hypothetical protein HO133_011023 [Letharia lupina]|uniref:Opioid growth factor receptor (OGFr) conserved domain-containing protein n=1 Tax=Letharia lupina TaxID=560253 RepID=A0A8H6CJU6_9LECA|nr:uncharacterized protein HO133_011023 [Letharia lupina]KAF6224446.1 hypothetical protein HO133_011023 [Letharia lupina]